MSSERLGWLLFTGATAKIITAVLVAVWPSL